MSRDDKLIAKLRRRPPEADFGDLQKVLEMFGWELKRVKGSHHHFTKPGADPPIITIPVHGSRVKGVYVKKILSYLELDE